MKITINKNQKTQAFFPYAGLSFLLYSFSIPIPFYDQDIFRPAIS
jgi:hypothetical protein